MRMKTLGLILVMVGMVGAIIAFLSGMIQDTTAYNRMGVGAIIIQLIGLAGIYIDRN